MSPRTGTPSSSSLTQPRSPDCQSSFPPNSKAVPESQSFVPPRLTEDEPCWLQKIRIFPRCLNKECFPRKPPSARFWWGLHGVGRSTWSYLVVAFSPWIRARSSWFASGMGRSSETELVPLVCTLAPLSRCHPALQGGSQTIPGPILQLLDPTWPLCADKMLFFKLKNWSPYK